jgi:protein-L-isoaspartate(D-aspartate) O-methyltransferase
LATRQRKSDPRPQAFGPLRDLMVQRHVAGRGVTDPRVLGAMREVPRHLFVPPAMAAKAYGPSALPIGYRQTISQPYIVGRMLELLDLQGDERVLEIGTGTGYQAALLARLASQVFTIERIPELGVAAVENVQRLGIPNVSVKVFDGTFGWSDQAPFDRIIVAAAAPAVPDTLVQQLARRGKMVLPIGPVGDQRLARVCRVATTLQIEDCGSAEFVPLVGRFGWRE